MFGSDWDDLKLAGAFLNGSRRALRVFTRRYGDAAEIGLEHAPRALQLGLRLHEYIEGVARSASRTLIDSVPASPSDERLDPHVQRVLGHRDFALTLLMSRGVPAAWAAFESRFGDYLRSIFIRTGHRSEVAARQVSDVIDRLRGGGGPDGTISEYLGQCDLRVWLFVFVRTHIEGRWRRETERPDLHLVPIRRDGSDLVRIVDLAGEVISELDEEDRFVLHQISRGAGPARVALRLMKERGKSLTTAAVARRHREVVRSLHDRIVGRFARVESGERGAVEQRVLDVTLDDAATRLGPVYGVEARS